MKEKLNKIFVPIIVILCGSYFAFKYADNLYRDYYFLFHKNKATANIINVANDRVKSCIIKISYDNTNTHQVETCDFASDFNFGNKVQTGSINNTDIYYTTYDPCDIYVIDYKSPTIAIIIIRVIISILIMWGILYYFAQLFKNIVGLLKGI